MFESLKCFIFGHDWYVGRLRKYTIGIQPVCMRCGKVGKLEDTDSM